MFYRKNVKDYLTTLKTKYTDPVRAQLLNKSISFINELDYLEMKSPQQASQLLANKFKLIDRL